MSFSDPESARLREAFASLSQKAAENPDCPDPDRLWQATRGELPPAETRNLIDHTARCPSCAEDWRLAREIGAGGRSVAVHSPDASSSGGRGLWYLAVAAALAVAIGALLWQTSKPGDSPAEYRSLSERTIQTLAPEDLPLPKDRLLLRWSTEVDIDFFNVRVATEDLEILSVARGLEQSEFLVPISDLEGLAAGDRILWQVEVVTANGERLVSSTFVNRLE